MVKWEILHYGAIEAENVCVFLLAFWQTFGNEKQWLSLVEK